MPQDTGSQRRATVRQLVDIAMVGFYTIEELANLAAASEDPKTKQDALRLIESIAANMRKTL